MTCRSCGATIADKAIVCYRCGTPTAVAVPAPAARARRRVPGWVIAVAVLALTGAVIWLAVTWLARP